MKKNKFVIAIYLINPDNNEEFLAVKRPQDDHSLPNVWGLPAITTKEGELPEEAVRRLGREKLNTQIEPVSFIGIRSKDKGSHESILMDVVARLVGKAPSVFDAQTSGTKYVDQQWTNDHLIFREAALKGSLCSQILLDFKGISY